MYPLGTRPIEAVDTLEIRIERRLNEALERAAAAGADRYETCGLAMREPAEWPVMRLSMADVARIAAQEARAWF